MDTSDGLGDVVGTRRRNTILAWVLVGFVLLVVPASVLDGDLLWAGFAAGVAAIALIPPLAYRDPAVMLPWEVLGLAALPLIGRTFATVPVTGRFAMYLSVAALALIVAVELDVFTAVRMTPGFAVLFVVVATMATAGVWAVTRWLVDVSLGTAFLLQYRVDPTVTAHDVETGLMWEFVYSTAAGLVAGVIFELYFRRRVHLRGRLPEGVEGA